MVLSPVPKVFKNVNPANGEGFLAPSEEDDFSLVTPCVLVEIYDIS
jgi:hypothetical protein